MAADGPAPNNARPSVDTVLTTELDLIILVLNDFEYSFIDLSRHYYEGIQNIHQISWDIMTFEKLDLYVELYLIKIYWC